ncbi:MAG: serine hydrolase [candidate division Zixibacteria bacterium]|nr:serine hydrolase [candidate division Zixibacteria bacterium]
MRSGFVKVMISLGALLLLSVNQINNLEGSERLGPVQPTADRYAFDFESVKSDGPRLNLRSAILVNYDNGEVLYAKNAEMSHPIASISKLVAAMVVLDNVKDFTAKQTVNKEDALRSSFSRLRPGLELSLRDLLYLSLMISDNRATRALSRATAGSITDFVDLMNMKVRQLGLDHTVFYDPTGLDERNVSTAHEVAILMHHAYSYPEIARITALKRQTVSVKRGKRTYSMDLRNTNRLMDSPYHVLAGKTGYIDASDYCLATMVEDPAGKKLTLVVLGAPGGSLRFREARKLASWGFKELNGDTVPVPSKPIRKSRVKQS